MKKLLILIALVIVVAGAGSYFWWPTVEPIFEPSVAALSRSAAPPIDGASVRSTASGQVAGFADSYNTYGWLNIPYAAPPVNDLRWRAPQPVASWQGIREANVYGEPCLQFWGVVAGVAGKPGSVVGSEDCLSLNIWAPQNASAQNLKPVMVWIHGGGNEVGTANIYQAHHLAGSQDVIVVTLNYRLGLFGWLSHRIFRESALNLQDASGNFGTLDLIASLQWVQANIAEFGGDPNQVTIFGESAGGKNVFSLLASPLAKGLFQRAISQSGSTDTAWLTMAEDLADKAAGAPISGLVNSSSGLLAAVLQQRYPELPKAEVTARLTSVPAAELVHMMRSVGGAELLNLASKNLDEVGEQRVATVIRDGYVIPQTSIQTLLQNPEHYNSVPLLLGSNRDEQKMFLSRDPEFVEFQFGVLPRIKDSQRYARVARYFSENWKASAVDEPANVIVANNGAPVYTYRFDWDELPSTWMADLPNLVGAAHGLELSFVFGDFTGGIPIQRLLSSENAAGRKALSLTMMDYWGQFAHTGDPRRGTSGQQAIWRPYRHQGKNIMLLETPAEGGNRMVDLHTRVAGIKSRLRADSILSDQKDKCETYAKLFLHGYMANDFWDADEYQEWGCKDYPALRFRQG